MDSKTFSVLMRRAIVVVVPAMLLLTTAIPSLGAFPSQRSLGMPANPKAASRWCWVSSSTSIMYHFGTLVAQCTFVNETFGRTDCPDYSASILQAQATMLEHHGFRSTYIDDSLAFSTIQSEVYGNKPIYAAWQMGTGGGHAVAVEGYRVDNGAEYVSYMNPDRTLIQTELYSWFVGGGSSSSDHTWVGSLHQFIKP